MMPPLPKLDLSANETLCRLWLGMAIIAALTVLLVPMWSFDLGRLHAELVSFYLLPTVGFWLALRRGAVDLSVWAVAGLGGVVAAWLINAGLPMPAACGGAIAAGLIIGAANGYVAGWTRLSSVAFTIIVAAIIVSGIGYITSERTIRVDSAQLGRWQEYARLLTGGAWALTMAVTMHWGVASRKQHSADLDPRVATLVAMAASGALAAAGGAIWLIDQGSAPVPTRLIDDLRIPAAALLAGGLLWTGRNRTLISGLFLPIALLLATIWRQELSHLPFLRDSGYALQTALLIGLLLTAHIALVGLLARRRGFATVHTAWLALTLVAVVVMGGAATVDSPETGKALILAALCPWALAVAGMVVTGLASTPRRAGTVD